MISLAGTAARVCVAATVSALLCSAAAAQGIDYSKLEIETTALGNGVYILNWQGGDSLILVGDDGVLLVDTSVAAMGDKIRAAIAKVSDKPIKLIVNTHAHADHFGANEALAKGGATIVAHTALRERMAKGFTAFGQPVPPAAPGALPSVVYDDAMTLNFNGETVQLFHPANAHTDSDTLVHFKRANVIHASGTIGGDGGYVFFDMASGGSLAGTIAAEDKMLSLADDKTRIVADEGAPASTAMLKAQRDMLVALRTRVQTLIDEGKSEDEAVAAKPTKDFDAQWVRPGSFLTGDALTRMAYQSLRSAGSAPTLAESPATAAAFGRIEQYLFTESELGGRRAGLLSLVAARELNLAYQWSVREDAARAAGLEPAVIDVVRRNQPLDALSRDDALLVDFGRQLYRNRYVRSETFVSLVDRFGKQGAFDAMMLLGYPAMIGVVDRAVDRQPPAGWDAARLPRVSGVGTPIGRPGDFVTLAERPALPSDVHEDSYYRFPLLKRSELDARAQAIFDRAVGADRDTTPRGPVGMTFLSPELVEPVQAINTAVRTNGALGTRTAEIVVAATGREMNSQYQWVVHGAAADAAGAGQAVLDTIRDDKPVVGLDERDAVAITFTREIFRDERVRPETLVKAVEIFGRRGAIEMAALIGDYLMMTTVYNALGMRLRPEQSATLPHRVGAPVGAEWR